MPKKYCQFFDLRHFLMFATQKGTKTQKIELLGKINPPPPRGLLKSCKDITFSIHPIYFKTVILGTPVFGVLFLF